jgi:hypothetical protein
MLKPAVECPSQVEEASERPRRPVKECVDGLFGYNCRCLFRERMHSSLANQIGTASHQKTPQVVIRLIDSYPDCPALIQTEASQ